MKRIFWLATILIAIGYSVSYSEDESEAPFRRQELGFKVGQFTVAGDLLIPKGGRKYPVVVNVWGSGPTNRESYIERSKLLKEAARVGFAVYVYDKPGSGGSTGDFTSGKRLHERAAILAKAIDALKTHPAVDAEKIGLFGSSQAGYVMPLAFTMTPDIRFMVAWSCPAMNSLEQSAYLVEQYMLCEGASPEEAATAAGYFVQRGEATDYSEYLEAATYLDSIPAISDGLGWGGVIPENEYAPADSSSEAFFDPSGLIAEMKIPILALFAEKDRQINAVQGAAVYRDLLGKSGNELSEVRVIPGVDHNMIVSTTGCMQLQQDNYKALGGAKVPPEFYDTVIEWLKKLKDHLD